MVRKQALEHIMKYIYRAIVLAVGLVSSLFAIKMIWYTDTRCIESGTNNSIIGYNFTVAHNSTSTISNRSFSFTNVLYNIFMNILPVVSGVLQVGYIIFEFTKTFLGIRKIHSNNKDEVAKLSVEGLEERLFKKEGAIKYFFYQSIYCQSSGIVNSNTDDENTQLVSNETQLNDQNKLSIIESGFIIKKEAIINQINDQISYLQKKRTKIKEHIKKNKGLSANLSKFKSCCSKAKLKEEEPEKISIEEINLLIQFFSNLDASIVNINFQDLQNFSFTQYEKDASEYTGLMQSNRLDAIKWNVVFGGATRICDVLDSLLAPFLIILEANKGFMHYVPKFLKPRLTLLVLNYFRGTGHMSRLTFEHFLRSSNMHEVMIKNKALLDQSKNFNNLFKKNFTNYTVFDSFSTLKKRRQKELELFKIKLPYSSGAPQKLIFYLISYATCFMIGMIGGHLGIATIATIIVIMTSTSITDKYDNIIKNLNTSLGKEDTSKNNRWINFLNTLILLPEISSTILLADKLRCVMPNFIENFSDSFKDIIPSFIDKSIRIFGVARGFVAVVASLALQNTILENPNEILDEYNNEQKTESVIIQA